MKRNPGSLPGLRVIEHSPPDELLKRNKLMKQVMDVIIEGSEELGKRLDAETVEAVIELALTPARLAECQSTTTCAVIMGMCGTSYAMIRLRVKSASGYEQDFTLRVAHSADRTIRIIQLISQ